MSADEVLGDARFPGEGRQLADRGPTPTERIKAAAIAERRRAELLHEERKHQ